MHSIDGVERLTGEHLYVVTNHEDVDGRLQSLELDFVLRRPGSCRRSRRLWRDSTRTQSARTSDRKACVMNASNIWPPP